MASIRNEFLAALTKQGAGIKVADCTANGMIVDPTFRPLLDAAVANPNATPDADAAQQFQQTVLAIAACADIGRSRAGYPARGRSLAGEQLDSLRSLAPRSEPT